MQEPSDIQEKDENETSEDNLQNHQDINSSLEPSENHEVKDENDTNEASKDLFCNDCNKVRNIWFLSSLVPSKREKNRLVLFSLYIF